MLRWLFNVVVFGNLALHGARADEPATAVKSPLSPAEALRHFRLAPGLRIEVVAAEPEVVDPVAIAFDEDSRLWVVEMRDYPNGPARGEAPTSCIKWLEDKDGDGRYETAHLFADKLLFPTGIQPWKGGVIVTLAGEIAYFEDTDGDGRADRRQTWFRGFVQENPQLRANHPTFAHDNHIYVANGLRGGTIVAEKETWGRGHPPVSISGKDFRFDPLTGACEAVAGHGQFGMTFDDWGNRFVCDNRHPCRHVVLEDRYTRRNQYLAVREVVHDACDPAENSHVHPLSRAWTTSTLHAGQFTAACGTLIYRGRGLPEAFYGNVFICEPTGNLVHREILESAPRGVRYANASTFYGRPAEKEREFLATADEWFRPVDLTNGPDGALYVVDMYRAVIEHPEWVPQELKNRPDERLGDDRGRIYRVISDSAAAAPRGLTRLSRATNDELVALVAEADSWRRETAARLLFERQDRSVVAGVQKVAQSAERPEVRIRVLWLLEGLGALTDETINKAAGDADKAVRAQAFVLAEPRLNAFEPESPLIAALLALEPPVGRFDFQRVLTLGELADMNRRLPALAAAALEGSRDEWLRRAVLTAAGEQPHHLLREVLTESRFADYPRFPAYALLLRDLCEVIGARREPAEISPALAALLTLREVDEENRKQAVQRIALAIWNGLAQGLARRGDSMAAILDRIEEREPGVHEALTPFFDEIRALAGRDTAAPELRLDAIAGLGHTGYVVAGKTLTGIIASNTGQPVRLKAIDSLAAYSDPQVADTLLEEFAAKTPAIRRAVLQALLRDEGRTRRLLAEIAAKHIAPGELDPLTVQALTKHKDAAIREEAGRLLASALPADRKKVLDAYQKSLTLKADAKRGRVVFEKHCATCHRIGNLGTDVAPDIADSRTKTPAQLLVDILNPNQAIDNNYISYTALLKSGKAETGVIAAETAVSITLRQPEGKMVQLLRQDIDELRSNGVSLMPEGLEKNIPVAEMADLISFIKNWRYLDGAVPLANEDPTGRSRTGR